MCVLLLKEVIQAFVSAKFDKNDITQKGKIIFSHSNDCVSLDLKSARAAQQKF